MPREDSTPASTARKGEGGKVLISVSAMRDAACTLSDRGFCLQLILESYAWKVDFTWVSVKTLAKRTNRCERTVRNGINDLIAAGWVRRERDAKGRLGFALLKRMSHKSDSMPIEDIPTDGAATSFHETRQDVAAEVLQGEVGDSEPENAPRRETEGQVKTRLMVNRLASLGRSFDGG